MSGGYEKLDYRIWSLIFIHFRATLYEPIWNQESSAELWDFVPENPGLVYESNDLGGTLLRLQDLESFQSLIRIPSLGKLPDHIAKIERLTGLNSFYSFLDKTSGIISLHNTGKNEFDFLYLVAMNDLDTTDVVSKLITPLVSKALEKQPRTYLGLELNEVSLSFTAGQLTYLIYNNYFIASFTPYLVEDAIRTFEDENYKSFREVFAEHHQITKIKQDEGNVYLNYKSFLKGSQAFAANDLDKKFLTSAVLDLNIEDDHISLSGFSFADSSTQPCR